MNIPIQDALELFIGNAVNISKKYKSMAGNTAQAEAYFIQSNGPENFYVG